MMPFGKALLEVLGPSLWREGMRTVPDPAFGADQEPFTWVLPVVDGGLCEVGPHYGRKPPHPSAWGQCRPGGGLGTRLPDLDHAGTRGLVLEGLRERWNEPTLHLHRIGIGWVAARRPARSNALQCLEIDGTWGHSQRTLLIAQSEAQLLVHIAGLPPSPDRPRYVLKNIVQGLDAEDRFVLDIEDPNP